MGNTTLTNLSLGKLTEKDFAKLSGFIYEEYGIKLTGSKKTMLEARLQKRLRRRGMRSFSEYTDFVFSPDGLKYEMVHMIDVVTTNKTEFFRESDCYHHLLETMLPETVNEHGSGIKNEFKIWSAGCSSGEEPYTLAMVMSKFVRKCPEFKFSILATDISTRMLKTAMRAIYDEDKIIPVPEIKRKKYFMVSKDRASGLVRIVPELRSLVKFQRLNLVDKEFGMNGLKDMIFCRNVIIYFDRETQERILTHFCNHLKDSGIIVLGHSEILTGMNVPLKRIAPAIYMKT